MAALYLRLPHHSDPDRPGTTPVLTAHISLYCPPPQLGAGVAAFAVKGKMSGEIRKKMLSQVGHYDEAGYEAVTKAWDAVQERLECCGVEDWTDWLNSTSVPDSCCLGNQAGCGLQATEDTVHTRGCFSAFKQKFVDNLDNVGSKLCKLVNYCIMS